MEFKTTIEFKSTEPNFRNEASGVKSNIVRIVDEAEDLKLKEYAEDIKYIRIKCVDGIQSFVEELTNITRFTSNGLIIYIFSW